MYESDPTAGSSSTAPGPIRFRVRYRSPESLVTEYTKCVSKGGCELVAKRPIARGTRFVFEMSTSGQSEPLQIEGEVVRVRPIKATSNFEVGVQYRSSGPQREVVDALLSRIGVDPNYELVRRHPRIPVNLVACDGHRPVAYLIRDLSRSGMRIEGRSFADDIRVGTPVELAAWLVGQPTPITIRGQVAWLQRGSRIVRTLMGVKFDAMEDPAAMVIDGMTRLLRPQDLRLTIGDDSQLSRGSDRQSTVSPREMAELIIDNATQTLVDLPDLCLTPAGEVSPTGERIAVQLGVLGDIEGELILEVSMPLSNRVATETLWPVGDVPDRSLVVDAVMEWATVLGGSICDRLEDREIELELTAPLEGIPVPRLDDCVVTAAFQGPFGAVVLTVITRDPSPSAWPG